MKELGFVGPTWRWVRPPSAWITRTTSISTYKALVDLDATLWLHPSRPPIIPDYTDEKLSQYLRVAAGRLALLHDVGDVSHCVRGVVPSYPTIRIVTHHHGAFVPLLEARLTNGWPLLEPVGLPMPTKISKPYVDHFG